MCFAGGSASKRSRSEARLATARFEDCIAPDSRLDQMMRCWRQEEEPVTAEAIIGNLTKNAANSRELLRMVIPSLNGGRDSERDCPCATALKNAIVTPPANVQPECREKLNPIVGKYVS